MHSSKNDHCGRFRPAPLSRREMLKQTSGGFGALALAATGLISSGSNASASDGPFKPGVPHHAPRAKNVIFLYMDGGVSQVDSFDPKPELDKTHGQPFKMKIEPTQFNNIGKSLKSPWEFRRYGESGLEVSDLFPHVGSCADDLCVVRSMVSKFSEHQTANFFLHTCFGQQGRPSVGAWVGYGLGTECNELPSYVVINGGLIPSGGLDNFGSSFLPAAYQGTIFKPSGTPVANINPIDKAGRQRRKLDLLSSLEQDVYEDYGKVDEIESAIANYEMAFRMQMAVPDLTDFKQESKATQSLYGLDSKNGPTRTFGTQCLLARRMVERGVRFVELTCPHTGNDRWDAHNGLVKNHQQNAKAVDQPVAALIKDLKARGLLDDTLIVWTGEFGRTPFAQGKNGRDHNPFAFTTWMAGGGMKPGVVYGKTDDFGYRVVEDRVEMYDLHATILHQLGMDHKKLTYLFGGRNMRLTDVHGEVVHELIA